MKDRNLEMVAVQTVGQWPKTTSLGSVLANPGEEMFLRPDDARAHQGIF